MALSENLMEPEDVRGLKSALERSKQKIQVQREEIAALTEECAQLKQAFDKLAEAIALRNPAPPSPCSK